MQLPNKNSVQLFFRKQTLGTKKGSCVGFQKLASLAPDTPKFSAEDLI